MRAVLNDEDRLLNAVDDVAHFEQKPREMRAVLARNTCDEGNFLGR
jgi:hypothetical protein